MSDAAPPEGPRGEPERRRRFEVPWLGRNWARWVLLAALVGGVWAVAQYVAVSTVEGECAARLQAQERKLQAQVAEVTAQVAELRTRLNRSAEEVQRERKSATAARDEVRRARADLERAQAALREVEEGWQGFYRRLPADCRLRSLPTPRPRPPGAAGADNPPGDTPAPETPGRVEPRPRPRP